MENLTCKLLVIGGGPGGYVCAVRAAQLGVETIIVESPHSDCPHGAKSLGEPVIIPIAAAIANAVAVVVLGPAVLAVLRRAARRATVVGTVGERPGLSASR